MKVNPVTLRPGLHSPKGAATDCIPMRPPVAFASLNQLVDFALGQLFSRSDPGVLGPGRRDFPFYSVWRYDVQGGFVM
jgi:hypothetical protein